MGETLRDSANPKHPRANRHNQPIEKYRKFRSIQIRYVYENNLVGEWFYLSEVWELPVLPNEHHKVAGLQFRDREED